MGKQLTDAVPLDDDTELEDGAGVGAGDGTGDAPGAQDTSASGAGEAGAQGAAAADDQDAAALAAVAADAEGEDDEGAGANRSAPRIPKDRFDEVNERRKAAESEAAQLRQMLGQVLNQQTAAPTTADPASKPRDFEAEFVALQERYDSGDLDDAGLRREERKLGVEQAKAEVAAVYEPKLQALQRERDAEQQQRVQEEWAHEVADAIKAYPFLNHEASEANREAINAVRAECEELVRAGIAAPKALRLAVRDVAPQYGTAAKPSVEDAAAARKVAARTALAAAENAQPSSMGGVGNGVSTQGKQRLTASVKDFDKWEKVPEPQREQAFTA